MAHQAFGYSFVLTCLYFSPYLLFARDAALFCIAAGLAAAGAAFQFFLLRKKKARWLPLLCAGVLAVLEAQYQLTAFHIIDAMKGHAIWDFIFFGVAALFVLLGAALGWLGYRAWILLRSRGGERREL